MDEDSREENIGQESLEEQVQSDGQRRECQ